VSLVVPKHILKHTVFQLLIRIGFHYFLWVVHLCLLLAICSVALGDRFFEGLDKALILAFALNHHRLFNVIEVIQVLYDLLFFLEQAVGLLHWVAIAVHTLRCNLSVTVRLILKQIQQTVSTTDEVRMIRV